MTCATNGNRFGRAAPLLGLLAFALVSGCSDDGPAATDIGVDLSDLRALPDRAAPDVSARPDQAPDMTLPDTALPVCPDGGAADLGVATASVTGHAFHLAGNPWNIVGAHISVLEQPCKRTVSDSKAAYAISGLKVGSPVTMVLNHPSYHPLQTATLTLPNEGLKKFTFQAVNHMIFKAFGALTGNTPDPTMCQISTTVTRIGKDVYSGGHHGEEGATVTISPTLPAKHGPYYFSSLTMPDPKLKQTTEDGGAAFVNVPPGTYTLTAHKSGVTFHSRTVICRAGYLVNASPPWGLQAYK